MVLVSKKVGLFGEICFELKMWWIGRRLNNRIIEPIEIRKGERKDWEGDWSNGVVFADLLSFKSGEINNKRILMKLLTSFRFWENFHEYYDDRKDLASFNFDRFTGDGYKIYKIISPTISERVL